ncbi:MAG: urea ABC transporter ATP-binding subunit UrtE [Beijerinckiaceae bacterium]
MLSVDNITLHYGAAQALRGVSMTADIGKITCVLGRNGVGKTSLLRAIAGHHPTSSGSISFDGTALGTASPDQRARRGLGYVPQGREIFPLLSVRENLVTGFAALPRGERHVPDEVFDLFPVLKEMLGRRGGDLSGGQQQQLAIARALVMRPRLLVLDEPTEGIQPSIIKQIGEALKYLRGRGQMAIVLVEQYLDFALDLGDSFAVLDRGQVICAGAKGKVSDDDIRSAVAI